MNSSIFDTWFKNEFVPKAKQFLLSRGLLPKAILLLDNAACHPRNLVEGGIQVIFLPPNVTTVIQPLDQEIIQNFESNDRIHLMTSVRSTRQLGSTLPQQLKDVTMREVVLWSAKAWNEVPPSTISKCWRPLISEELGRDLESHAEIQNRQMAQFLQLFMQIEAYKNITESGIREWLSTVDAENRGPLTVNEIIDMVQPPDDESKEPVREVESDMQQIPDEIVTQETHENFHVHGDDVDNTSTEDVLPPDAAVKAEDSLIDFFEHHGSLSPVETTTLWSIRHKASIIKFQRQNSN